MNARAIVAAFLGVMGPAKMLNENRRRARIVVFLLMNSFCLL